MGLSNTPDASDVREVARNPKEVAFVGDAKATEKMFNDAINLACVRLEY